MQFTPREGNRGYTSSCLVLLIKRTFDIRSRKVNLEKIVAYINHCCVFHSVRNNGRTYHFNILLQKLWQLPGRDICFKLQVVAMPNLKLHAESLQTKKLKCMGRAFLYIR